MIEINLIILELLWNPLMFMGIHDLDGVNILPEAIPEPIGHDITMKGEKWID